MSAPQSSGLAALKAHLADFYRAIKEVGSREHAPIPHPLQFLRQLPLLEAILDWPWSCAYPIIPRIGMIMAIKNVMKQDPAVDAPYPIIFFCQGRLDVLTGRLPAKRGRGSGRAKVREGRFICLYAPRCCVSQAYCAASSAGNQRCPLSDRQGDMKLLTTSRTPIVEEQFRYPFQWGNANGWQAVIISGKKQRSQPVRLKLPRTPAWRTSAYRRQRQARSPRLDLGHVEMKEVLTRFARLPRASRFDASNWGRPAGA